MFFDVFRDVPEDKEGSSEISNEFTFLTSLWVTYIPDSAVYPCV